jgi:hypothetical protein
MLFSTFRPSRWSKTLPHAFWYIHECSCTKLHSKGATSILVKGIGSTIATSAASRALAHGRDFSAHQFSINACHITRARPLKTNQEHDPCTRLGEVFEQQIMQTTHKQEVFLLNVYLMSPVRAASGNPTLSTDQHIQICPQWTRPTRSTRFVICNMFSILYFAIMTTLTAYCDRFANLARSRCMWGSCAHASSQ